MPATETVGQPLHELVARGGRCHRQVAADLEHLDVVRPVGHHMGDGGLDRSAPADGHRRSIDERLEERRRGDPPHQIECGIRLRDHHGAAHGEVFRQTRLQRRMAPQRMIDHKPDDAFATGGIEQA